MKILNNKINGQDFKKQAQKSFNRLYLLYAITTLIVKLIKMNLICLIEPLKKFNKKNN
jgi:hypothetical protein